MDKGVSCAAVSECVDVAAVSESVTEAVFSKGGTKTAASKGVVIAVVPKGVGTTVDSEETVIIKILFIGTYILLNNIRISVIRYVQRHIRKRSS